MLQFNTPTTELTTAATDALLGILCLFLIVRIVKFQAFHPWKVRLWSWVFGLLAAVSFLGSIAHGVALSPALRNFLWQPLYLGLGIDVALFLVGSVFDWRGEKTARRLVPAAIVAGAVFFSFTAVLDGSFLIFVAYEGATMTAAMGIYLAAAIRHRLPGAAIISTAIGLTIVAAAFQASTLRFTIIWPFDHNGIFHLVQMAAQVILAHGLCTSLKRTDHILPS